MVMVMAMAMVLVKVCLAPRHTHTPQHTLLGCVPIDAVDLGLELGDLCHQLRPPRLPLSFALPVKRHVLLGLLKRPCGGVGAVGSEW